MVGTGTSSEDLQTNNEQSSPRQQSRQKQRKPESVLDDPDQLDEKRFNSEIEELSQVDVGEEIFHEPKPDDITFSMGTEEIFPNQVVNFPNGNSSSSFPNLSSVTGSYLDVPLQSFDGNSPEDVSSIQQNQAPNQTTLDQQNTPLLDPSVPEPPPRNISPPKTGKTQERRNRAEEINVDNSSSYRVVPKFDYTHQCTEDFQTEIKEWFLLEDNNLLYELKTQYTCSYGPDWSGLPDHEKSKHLNEWLSHLESDNEHVCNSALAYVAYVSLGSYGFITSTGNHVSRIKANTKFLWKHGALMPLYKLIIRKVNIKVPPNLYQTDYDEYISTPNERAAKEGVLNNQLFIALTAMYFIIENNRDDPEFAHELDKLNPSILHFIIEAMSRLRWGIGGNLPLRPMLLLFWKCMLCLFGTDEKLDKMKKYMLTKYNLPDNDQDDLVMSSPLDYHAFRQDIMSRYPSYIPPSSALPKNFENSRSMSHFIEVPRPVIAQTSNNALPIPTVHIATPAPSPPASPAIASGQKVRKSVFMTNQSFPFIHPTDGNIPQSIVEASELFHSRIHTTPGMVQLWEERDKFMQQERGWVPAPREKHDFQESEEQEVILERIEKLYIDAMPHINSFILVLLKFLLANMSFSTPESHIDTYLSTNTYPRHDSRAKDIGLKATSATILCLVDWFNVSHICKFEFLSTLLFDSRYYLLVFKYFYLHTPIEKALQIIDSPREDFFIMCKDLSSCWDDEEEQQYQQSVAKEKEELLKEQIKLNEVTSDDESDRSDDGIFNQKFNDFSRRYFCTTINLLKVLREITHKKTQRVIVMAELPADTLKKALSIYQSDIWTIVLDLFKEQVPFNGRKWRSSNMDLVSAIYLHCKTKLRDDWLVNGDANAEVEDAQPQEIAIRALIQFYNERLRREVLNIHQIDPNGKRVDRSEILGENGNFENLEESTITDDEEPPDFFSLELDALALDNVPM